MKRLVWMIWIMGLLLGGITLYAQEQQVNIVVNDSLVKFETGIGEQKDYVTYVPAREMGTLLNVQVDWNQGIVLSKEKAQSLEIPAEEVRIQGGVSYIPIKYFGRGFGYILSVNNMGNVVRLYDQGATLTDEQVFTLHKVMPKPKAEKGKQKVYLTFDDGPNGHTEAILDLLKDYDMKATFFMLEGQMKKYPKIVKRMVEEGHSVALHGVSHDKNKFYANATSPLGEMNRANETLKNITGTTTKLVRMPYGSVPYLTDAQYMNLKKAGYRVWDWHVDSRDWANKNGKKSYESVTAQLTQKRGDGEVILFHDSKETVDSVERLLAWLKQNSYESLGLEASMATKTFKK